jgi:hypothetical protein
MATIPRNSREVSRVEGCGEAWSIASATPLGWAGVSILLSYAVVVQWFVANDF